MIKLFLIINCFSLAVIEAKNKYNSYKPTINRNISPITKEDEKEWIIRNCGVKKETKPGKREAAFKIYGGHETSDFQYPWAVGLDIKLRIFDIKTGAYLSKTKETICSGSLISRKHILTSQHCFTNEYDSKVNVTHFGSETDFKAKIVVGKGNKSPNLRYFTEERARYVKNLDYYTNDYTQMMNDWVIIELAREVPQELMNSKAIVPICLPKKSDKVPLASSDNVEIYGQGGRQPSEEASAVGIGQEIMRYIFTRIKSAKLYHNIISVEKHHTRQGDSGGGISKVEQVSVKPGSGSVLTKKQCNVLVGITRGVELGSTVAVDARSVTDTVQHLIGI